jgi:hypothetical protein
VPYARVRYKYRVHNIRQKCRFRVGAAIALPAKVGVLGWDEHNRYIYIARSGGLGRLDG